MGELKSKVEGNVNEAIGKAKQQSTDPETRADGKGQEVKGKAQQAKGEVQGALGDADKAAWAAPAGEAAA